MEGQCQNPDVPCVTGEGRGTVLHEPTTRQLPQVEVREEGEGRQTPWAPTTSRVPVGPGQQKDGFTLGPDPQSPGPGRSNLPDQKSGTGGTRKREASQDCGYGGWGESSGNLFYEFFLFVEVS